jgi:hypothetical protein
VRTHLVSGTATRYGNVRCHLRVGCANYEVLVAGLLERMDAVLACQQGITCSHVVELAIEDMAVAPDEDVVDLVK